MKRIYLDNNATTPIDLEVLEYFVSLSANVFGNPSSVHHEGRVAKTVLIEARKSLSQSFEVDSREIIFFPSATEALNTAIRSVIGKNSAGHVVSTGVEHPAVFDTLHKMVKNCTYIAVGEKGYATAEQVAGALRDDTCLVTCMSANNETGALSDIDGIATLCLQRGIPLIVDGVAHLGKAPLKIPQGVSCMVFSGHKIHAPKGAAVAICRLPFKLEPLFFGGPQESSKRPGTENIPAYAAFGRALELFKASEDAHLHHLKTLRDRFENGLQAHIPQVCINGENRVANTSNISFPDIDAETFLMELDLQGIAASHGSACASGLLEPSRVLTHMGLPRAQVLSSIRFSFGRQNRVEEVDIALSKIRSLISR